MTVEEGLKIFQQIATTLEIPHEKGIVELKCVNLPPLLPPGVHVTRTCFANLVAHSLRCLAQGCQLNKSFFYVKDSLCLNGYLLAGKLSDM